MTPDLWYIVSILLGMAVVPVATWLKQCQWAKWKKVALVVSLAAVLAVVQDVVKVSTGGQAITWARLLVDAAIVFASAQTWYATIWEKIEPESKRAAPAAPSPTP